MNVGLIISIIILIIDIIVRICDMYYTDHMSKGCLYYNEKEPSMYLELETNDIPENGYITLKIRRV